MAHVSEAKLLANRRNALAPNSGRPQGTLEKTTIYRKLFREYLVERINKEKGALITAMLKEAKQGKVEAFRALLEHAHGKPAQAVELSGTDGQPIVFMPLELIQKHALQVIDGNPENMAKNIEPPKDHADIE